MNNTTVLPEGYGVLFQMDLQKDKKLAVLVNVLALIIAAVMVAAALRVVPLSTLLDLDGDWKTSLLRLGVMIVGLIAYIFLHELVHGICMKAFGGVKPKYGFTGLYAYAGSDCYFNKRSYLIIALAPVVVWGIVLAAANMLCPPGWFWVVYLIQICNCSGAAGDLYVTWRFARFPQNILVQDTGVSMTVYAPQK